MPTSHSCPVCRHRPALVYGSSFMLNKNNKNNKKASTLDLDPGVRSGIRW